jgi:aminopeptidase N
VVTALGLIEELATVETDLTVWQRMVGVLDAVDRLVTDRDLRLVWQSLVTDIVRPALDRLGDTPGADETDRTRQLRGTLFGALGVIAADPVTRGRARDLLAGGSHPDPALAAAAVGVIAACGGPEDFADFVAHAAAATTPQDELRDLTALADFDHPELIERVGALCLDGTVRTQNGPYLLRRAMANRTQGQRAWSFVSTHWDAINERFPSNSIARMVEGVRHLDHPEVASRVFAFFETNEVPQGDRIVAQHLERLEVNLALRARATASLHHDLASR